MRGITKKVQGILYTAEPNKALAKLGRSYFPRYIDSLFSEFRGMLSEVRVTRDLLAANIEVEFNPSRKGPDIFLSNPCGKIPVEISSRVTKKPLTRQSMRTGKSITSPQIINEIINSSLPKIKEEFRQASVVILDISHMAYSWLLPILNKDLPTLAEVVDYYLQRNIVSRKRVLILYGRLEGRNYAIPLVY
ncbi:MAG: hypothetical protein ACTSUJ_05520 [Candidatus Njordarchaeales archaeon]